MAEVFNSSPFLLGKRGAGVLAPHHHNHHYESQEQITSAKKRRLLHDNVMAGGSDHGGACSRPSEEHNYTPKRMRTGCGSSPPPEAPQYSQRQLDEQLNRLRDEYIAHVDRRDEQIRTAAATEVARLTDACTATQRELEKTSNENKILRRAVGIQNNRCRELEGQLATAHQTAAQASDYIKRLEQTNYAMSLRISSMGMGAGGEFTQQGPPDVY